MSGLVGIWWLYDNLVIADFKTLDDLEYGFF